MAKTYISCVILLLLCTIPGWAESLVVPNYSFELPGDGKHNMWDAGTNDKGTFTDVPNWTSDTAAADSGVETATTTDGSYRGFLMASDPSVWQILNHTVTAGESYTLSVDVLSTWQCASFMLNLFYDNSGTRVTLATSTATITDSSVTYTLTAKSSDVPASIGKKIGIEMKAVDTDNYGWAGMDNVRLNVSYVEVITPANGAQNVAMDTNLQWTVTNGWACDVYFGTQNDPNMTSNPKVVDNQVQTSYNPPSGLNNETTYYWRVDAHEPNAPGADIIHIGPTWSFKTIPLSPVVTDPPENTLADISGTAALSITVASTTTPTYIWYKSTDNANNTVVDDTQVSTTVGGGLTNTLTINPVAKTNEGYYYCNITNVAGSTLSDVAILGVKRTVAHWTLDALDGSSNYPDTSGEGHDADPNGSPSFTTGVVGNAVNINPVSGYASCGTWNPSQYTNQFTISLWAKWAGQTTPVSWQGLISKEVSYGADTMMWQMEITSADEASSTLVLKNGISGDISTPVLPINAWEHLMVVYNGTTATVYRNGVQAGTGPWTPGTMVDAPMNIGASANNAGIYNFFFNGDLDDIQIFNYAKSNTEIADIYYAATGNPVCILDYANTYDFNKDCRINLADFQALAAAWLDCGLYPTCP
jgi:hypothetical protein